MLFQLEILDPKKNLILRDVFSLPNITILMEVCVGIMERFELDQHLKEGYESKITSEHGKHVHYWFSDVVDASHFKDAIYDYLIASETENQVG